MCEQFPNYSLLPEITVHPQPDECEENNVCVSTEKQKVAKQSRRSDKE